MQAHERGRMKPNMAMSFLFIMCAISGGEADYVENRMNLRGVQKQQTKTFQSLAHYTVSAEAKAGSAHFQRKRINVVSAEAKAIRVRYAGFAYDTQYIETTLLPQLASSMFQVEKFLAPSLPVKYTIYTSSLSDEPLKNMLNKDFPDVMLHISFLNLDEDPDDKIRMAAYKGLNLNDKNLASVRRMLADVHLPATEDRLFLGTDISFLKRPDDLLKKLQQHEEVVYMIDQVTWHGQKYKVTAYDGPQCEGLLGDLFYLAAGIKIPEEDAHQALKFYAGLPHYPPRITPPCEPTICDTLSGGLHAMDQFAWAMVLGKVSNGKCVALDPTKYHLCYPNCYPNADLEAVHDKEIRFQFSMPSTRSLPGITAKQLINPSIAPSVAQIRSAAPSLGSATASPHAKKTIGKRGVHHSGAVRIVIGVLVAFVAISIWQIQVATRYKGASAHVTKHAYKVPMFQ